MNMKYTHVHSSELLFDLQVLLQRGQRQVHAELHLPDQAMAHRWCVATLIFSYKK